MNDIPFPEQENEDMPEQELIDYQQTEQEVMDTVQAVSHLFDDNEPETSLPEEIPNYSNTEENSPDVVPVDSERDSVSDAPFDLSILNDPEFDIDESAEDTFSEGTYTADKTDIPDTTDSSESAFLTEEDSEDFQALFQTEAPAEEKINRPRTPKKGRPRRRKGEGLFGIPNILVTVVWLCITLAVGITLGRMLWVCASDVLAFGRQDQIKTVTIYETDDIETIATKLHNAELIRYPELFKLYAKFAVDEGEIHPGIWDLNTMYDYHALVKTMSPSSSRDVIKVMIPEGYSCRQIFDLLETNKVCTVKDLESYAASGELDEYWFLQNIERGSKYCLEGFLFPDTYEFYKNDSPRNVLEKLLNNFDNRFDEEMVGQIDTLNEHISDMMRKDGRSEDYIANHLFTIKEIITVASMVEKETSSAQESFQIASVIYNRLFAWGGTPAYLNIDATIIYALDGKTDLTVDDLQVDSPYNTYFNVGLTPGPIANPGLSSIKAALNPAETDYYFYILDPNAGAHHFSRTVEEHEAFRQSLRG